MSRRQAVVRRRQRERLSHFRQLDRPVRELLQRKRETLQLSIMLSRSGGKAAHTLGQKAMLDEVKLGRAGLGRLAPLQLSADVGLKAARDVAIWPGAAPMSAAASRGSSRNQTLDEPWRPRARRTSVCVFMTGEGEEALHARLPLAPCSLAPAKRVDVSAPGPDRAEGDDKRRRGPR